MSRFAAVTAAILLVAGYACSKSQESAQKGPGTESPTVTGTTAPTTGSPGSKGSPEGMPAGGGEAFRLLPAEGSLAIEVSPGAKAGTEVTANIVVTPGAGFKVNTEYPTKLTLQQASGVTIAKSELKAGGPDKSQGDANEMSEQKLVFAVKLTPAASGNYTVNGSFKFAVCDKDQCLPKKEAIAIQVAAN